MVMILVIEILIKIISKFKIITIVIKIINPFRTKILYMYIDIIVKSRSYYLVALIY